MAYQRGSGSSIPRGCLFNPEPSSGWRRLVSAVCKLEQLLEEHPLAQVRLWTVSVSLYFSVASCLAGCSFSFQVVSLFTSLSISIAPHSQAAVLLIIYSYFLGVSNDTGSNGNGKWMVNLQTSIGRFLPTREYSSGIFSIPNSFLTTL